MRRALTLLFLSAGGVMLLVAPSTGHVFKTDTNVFVNYAALGIYKGKVVSPRSACEGGRTVKVFHDSDPIFRIGTTTTKDNGTWTLNGPEPPRGDKVYAVVTQSFTRRNRNHRHSCAFDRSPKVTYPKG